MTFVVHYAPGWKDQLPACFHRSYEIARGQRGAISIGLSVDVGEVTCRDCLMNLREVVDCKLREPQWQPARLVQPKC